MTRDEFCRKYRGRLMGWLAECYASRRLSPSEMGMEIDRMYSQLNALLEMMHADLDKPLPANGAVQPQKKGQTT